MRTLRTTGAWNFSRVCNERLNFQDRFRSPSYLTLHFSFEHNLTIASKLLHSLKIITVLSLRPFWDLFAGSAF
jgi:hypothetical protein